MEAKIKKSLSKEDMDDERVMREVMLKHIKEAFKATSFNVCETQPLHQMTCQPMKILLKYNEEPVKCTTAFNDPVHMTQDVKNDLDAAVRLGIIESVPNGESGD